MSARSLLQLYADRPDRPDRADRDRLEILTALTGGPSFDPVYRPDIIKIPRGHAIYRWECVVEHCERTRSGGADLCTAHLEEWVGAREAGWCREGGFPIRCRGTGPARAGGASHLPDLSQPAGGSHPAAALPAAHEPVPRQPGRRW